MFYKNLPPAISTTPSLRRNKLSVSYLDFVSILNYIIMMCNMSVDAPKNLFTNAIVLGLTRTFFLICIVDMR